jgi:hypothetical protein
LRRGARFAAAVGVLMLGVAACSSGGEVAFEEQVTAAATKAAEDGEDFSLPESAPSGAGWTEAALVCPYDPQLPEGAGADFEAAFSGLDTADDSSQWLLLHTDDSVETVTLGRGTVDACGGEHGATVVPGAMWSAQRSGDVVQVAPVHS